jgi:putative integral membrane protein (TIGR02587 family)
MSILSKYKANVWINEVNDIVRGACGGFLFGIPLLYTMEVWWIGSQVKPATVMLAIALTFLGVYLLNRTEGFRKRRRKSKPYEAVVDTIEAMGIGIVCTSIMLLLLREVTAQTSLSEALGKIIFESVPFTLGVALANQLLGDTRNPKEEGRKEKQPDQLHATLSDLGATLIGATIIGFNIAPTDEIPILAAAISEPRSLGIIAASLVITYGIVFEAGFADQQKRVEQKGIFQRPLSETITCYLISLMAATFMLWFFQRLTFSDPWTMWLDNVLLLGLPASIGGAAGRLAI